MTISAFPVVEAMASDVPVIASGSCRVEIVEDRETGFIVEEKQWPAGEDGTSRAVPAPRKFHLGKNW